MMGRSQFLLQVSASVAAWLCVASLAYAQDGTPSIPPQPAETPTMDEATPMATPMADSEPVLVLPNPGPMVDESTRLIFPNRQLLATGAATLLVSYIPTIIYQGVEDRNRDLYIPVAGPWLDLARGDDGNFAKVLLAADGALQGLAALALLASSVVPEKQTRRWFFGSSERALLVTPTQLARHGSYGLLASGRF